VNRVAVLGGGPAGSMAAHRLAAAGLNVTLIDEKLAWEKPCGGGLTFKAYRDYPFLIDNPAPKRFVHETVLGAAGGGQVTLKLDQPLVIYSRYDLNRFLLDRAAEVGAQLEKTRVTGLIREGRQWRIETTGGSMEADFCIAATGARNSLRNVGTELAPSDSVCALGYYIEGEQAGIEIVFPQGLAGYIWVFPRCGHLSVGICGKGASSQAMRAQLEDFMRERGISWKGARFYAHLLPSLEVNSWEHNRVAGDGWLAVGDAAGLVDPITGEGLYYAIRSGDLAAQSLLENESDPAAHYRAAVKREIMSDLQVGSRMARRFYGGEYLFGSVTARMVQFTRRSTLFREVMQDLFAGRQGYKDLKERLYGNLWRVLCQVALGSREHSYFGSRQNSSASERRT
jgi:geranylgeranyl reductase family protein